MAPSAESEHLKETWRWIANFPNPDNNVALERVKYDQISTCAKEPTDVTYEDIALGGDQRGPAKLVRPLNASKAHVLLFCHGGGYSFGSLDSHRKMCGHFAKSCNTLALMIDYRLTPENPYPAALDDCVAGYKWLIDQGFEAKHIVAIGDSCGGGLATTVPLKAIRAGLPAPAAAVALSPWFDVKCETSPSLTTTTDVLSDMPSMYKIRDRYCGANGSVADPEDPLISPIFASEEELAKLPPHWISCAGDDMLLDDGTRMAQKLQKAGVETVLKVHPGMQHVFEFAAGRMPEAIASVNDIGQWVRKKIGS